LTSETGLHCCYIDTQLPASELSRTHSVCPQIPDRSFIGISRCEATSFPCQLTPIDKNLS